MNRVTGISPLPALAPAAVPLARPPPFRWRRGHLSSQLHRRHRRASEWGRVSGTTVCWAALRCAGWALSCLLLGLQWLGGGGLGTQVSGWPELGGLRLVNRQSPHGPLYRTCFHHQRTKGPQLWAVAVAGSGCSLGAGRKPLCLGGECGRRGGAPDGPAPRPSRWHSLASLRASGGGRGQADHSLPGAPAAVSFPTVMSWQGRSQAQPRKTRRGTDGEAQPLTCAGWHLSEQRQTQAGTEAGRLDSVRGSLCTPQASTSSSWCSVLFKLTHNHSQVNRFKGASWRALHRPDRGPRSPSSPAH